MLKLLQDLYIPVSKSKLCPPPPTSMQLNCLGIMVDTVGVTLSIPQDKMYDIISKCLTFFHQKVYTKTQLQSVIAFLMYIHKVIKPARYFVNHLLGALRNFQGHNAICQLTYRGTSTGFSTLQLILMAPAPTCTEI